MGTELDSRIANMLPALLRGERPAVARCLRWIDDVPKLGRALAFELHAHLKGARVVGVTGNPGAGKSTVIDALITRLRQRQLKVAVLAVDPTSPFSGGAILGDRIRMSRHANDDGVFIRSLATRGTLGGLSAAAFDSVRVLDAAGFDVVLVETVGVGQDEVDIARLAETTVVVMVPGLGDDVQAIKAGILEIADVFLINKADREGVAQLERSLRQLLSLASTPYAWEPSIVCSVASTGEGIDALLDAIVAHGNFIRGPEGRVRAMARKTELFERLLDAALVESGRECLGAAIDAARRRLSEASADPYREVLRLLEQRKRGGSP